MIFIVSICFNLLSDGLRSAMDVRGMNRSLGRRCRRPGSRCWRCAGCSKYFPVRGGLFGAAASVRAVDDVSFTVDKGEMLGIVGESGCGKSTTARLLIGLIEPDDGEIDLRRRGGRRRTALACARCAARVQMVFQDSYASLNPRLTDRGRRSRSARRCTASRPAEARARAHDLLRKVGLDPALFAERYPHELSGGQRQRVNIARALALAPRLVLLDEAVSALDKSVEAQVLNLLLDLKDELGLTYVFISHDLNVVRYLSDRVVVMYLGEVVETAPVERSMGGRAHPYTRALLAAMPSMDPDARATEPPMRRRSAEPDRSAVRLPLPHPLSLRRAGLRRDRAAARGAEQRRPPFSTPARRAATAIMPPA